MEPFLFTFPSSVSEEVFFEHDGEEFVFVVAGRVRFLVDGREWVLNPGDSVYFDASLPHRGEAVGGEAKALVIIYTPPGEESREPKERAGGTTFAKTLRQRETDPSAIRRNQSQEQEGDHHGQ
jgi:hypothetical protein